MRLVLLDSGCHIMMLFIIITHLSVLCANLPRYVTFKINAIWLGIKLEDMLNVTFLTTF